MNVGFDTVRLNNLRTLISKFDSQKSFAKAIGKNASYLSQILSGHRKIGDRTCRDIELSLNLDSFAMDTVGGVSSADGLSTQSPLTELAYRAIGNIQSLLDRLPNEEECRLLELYRKSSVEARSVIMSVAKAQSAS